jgi:hypothetical protein
VSWAAHLGRLYLGATWLAFLGYAWTPWILTLLAIGELIVDQLPSTPSRTEPLGFGARIVSGALSGAAVGTAGGTMIGRMCRGYCRRDHRHVRRARLPRQAGRRIRHDRPARSSRTRSRRGALRLRRRCGEGPTSLINLPE